MGSKTASKKATTKKAQTTKATRASKATGPTAVPAVKKTAAIKSDEWAGFASDTFRALIKDFAKDAKVPSMKVTPGRLLQVATVRYLASIDASLRKMAKK